jgi:adenosylmethionine-8-amino-7-oxononanoate aminotransferase
MPVAVEIRSLIDWERSKLAKRVAALAPVPDSRVFLVSDGSDAVDSAAKLARRYYGFGTSLSGIEPNRLGFEPFVETLQVTWDSTAALEEALDAVGDRTAAFFCEPVIGAGDVLPPPAGYLARVREICRERDILFVADEVITGFGRCGSWFASERFDLEPDLLTCAKGITSGYLPLGAVLISPRVADPFLQPGVMWRHGYTYSGHATACAAALANLDIFEREGLIQQAGELESELTKALESP